MFKSFAQARKIKELVKEGKFKSSTAMVCWHKTDWDKIPERVNRDAKTPQTRQ